MTEQTTTITIDGAAVPVQAGDTVIDAAHRAGVYIPHLCFHPEFGPHGSCRLCMVKAGGRYVAACTTPATPGMNVESETAEIKELRLRITQMLFVDGNHFCPACEQSGQCQLQAMAYGLGMQDLHFSPSYPKKNVDASHDEMLLDRDRCIQCNLCVRASDRVDGKHVFSLGGRGTETRLMPNSASGLLRDTEFSAEDRAAHVCPVGALLFKHDNYARPIGRRLYDRTSIDRIGNRRADDAAPGGRAS